MEHMRLKTFLLSVIVTLVYSLNTWSSDFDGLPKKTMMVAGRIIYFDEKISKSVRQELLNEVNGLISQNSPDLKGINLEELKARTQKIVVVVADGKPFVGSGYRNGAVNFPEKETVVYNYGKLKNYSGTQRALIQWHEALGAMGYNDGNYLASTSITQKITAPKLQLHPQIQSRLKNQLNEPKMNQDNVWKEKDGGASGVGGGGDGDIAEIKWALLSYLNLLATQNELGDQTKSPKLIDLAIDTPLESTEFISKYQIISQFKNVKIARNKFTEKVCLLVDPDGWQPIDRTGGIVSENNLKFIIDIIIVLETIQEIGGLR